MWTDEVLNQSFPELFSFAKKKNITFNEAKRSIPIHSLFHLPLSVQTHEQLLQLQLHLDQMENSEERDNWRYIWNSKGFSVKKAYRQLSGHLEVHQVFKWVWKSSCQSKHKVCFWLLLRDRLSTRELLRRKRMVLPDYSCVLCNANVDESLRHLFLDCPFANQCWALVNIQTDEDLSEFQNLENFKVQLGVPFFMEVIVLIRWAIWKARNDLIFRQVMPNIQTTKAFFRSEFQLLLLRASRRYYPWIDQWIANLA